MHEKMIKKTPCDVSGIAAAIISGVKTILKTKHNTDNFATTFCS